MPKVFIEESTLTAIGDAIRGKTGKTDLLDPANMGTEIASIETGGGGGADLPDEVFSLTGYCAYRFANGGWDWFINTFSDSITTSGITNCSNMFIAAHVGRIPFDINVTNCNVLDRAFSSMDQLTESPKIRGILSINTSFTIQDIASNCYRVRDFEDLFLPSMFDSVSSVHCTSGSQQPKPTKFTGCYSLRRLPSWLYKFTLCSTSTAYPSATYTLYSGLAQNCHSLDEILNLPVYKCAGKQTSNMFTYTVSAAGRLKNFTFATDNGQPIVTEWKAQTIDFSGFTGYVQNGTFVTNYNSGITLDKRVTDDASYQALKNDPDWYTLDVLYSRYNHDSAVTTINSLPDTSAYLASAGGTNTVKFKKSMGSNTDGGAIENLTAEEIAVAAAKGWTVSLIA